MSRTLPSVISRTPICSSCLRAFRSSVPAATSLRRHNSTATNTTASTTGSDGRDAGDSMFSEIDFDGPRKVKEIVERYKFTPKLSKVGFTVEKLEQRAMEDDEVEPQEIRDGPSLPLAEQLKLQMRRVAYPVSLVTAYEKADDPMTWHAMTISSFNTVCMEPVPLISFNVKFPSTTGQLILNRELFTVNILCQHVNAAKISALFVSRPPKFASTEEEAAARNPTPGARQMREVTKLDNLKNEPKFRPTKGPFEGLPVYRTAFGLRLIPNILLAALGCQLRKVVNVGDHKLIIAEVLDVYGAVGDRPAERRRFHLQGHRLEREMAQTYRNGLYIRHRTENAFDVSKVKAGHKILMDDMTLDYKHMKRRTADPINEI